MNKTDIEAKFLGASIDQDISTIDLHDGGNISEALDHLERELFLFYQNQERYCRVVHGIGTGALANAVHQALSQNPLVIEYREAEDGGSCIVLV